MFSLVRVITWFWFYGKHLLKTALRINKANDKVKRAKFVHQGLEKRELILREKEEDIKKNCRSLVSQS